jgi:hypothetical protein
MAAGQCLPGSNIPDATFNPDSLTLKRAWKSGPAEKFLTTNGNHYRSVQQRNMKPRNRLNSIVGFCYLCRNRPKFGKASRSAESYQAAPPPPPAHGARIGESLLTHDEAFFILVGTRKVKRWAEQLLGGRTAKTCTYHSSYTFGRQLHRA